MNPAQWELEAERRNDRMREAEKARMARQYDSRIPALAQIGRLLENAGKALQQQHNAPHRR